MSGPDEGRNQVKGVKGKRTVRRPAMRKTEEMRRKAISLEEGRAPHAWDWFVEACRTIFADFAVGGVRFWCDLGRRRLPVWKY